MSDTDNQNQDTVQTPYQPGVAGTISGFGPPNIDSGENTGQVSFSIEQLMVAIRGIENKLNTNFGPSELQTLLSNHIGDYSNPHHDTFAQLGFNVARDLVGSILPGGVPNSPPVYAIDPLSLIPNNNLPSKLNLPDYVPDLNPVISAGTDNSQNDDYLLYDDDHRNPVSLKEFQNNTTAFGYETVPCSVLDIGLMGLLCQAPITIYGLLDNTAVTTDPNTTLTTNSWTARPDVYTSKQKIAPTLTIKTNVQNTDPTETTFTWYTLTNMPMPSNDVYIVFTTVDGSRIVIHYSKSTDGYPTRVSIDHQSGDIQPVWQTDYSIGGIRFNCKAGDELTVNYTTTGTNDWSNFSNEDIGFTPSSNPALPSTFLMKFFGGNPNFLLPYGREVVNSTPIGLLTSRPNGNNVTTSSLNWTLPKLAQLGFKGMMSISYLIDTVVSENTPGFKVFSSDALQINLTVTETNGQQVSRWDIWASDGGKQTFITSIGGYGGRMQSIAFAFDGVSFRGRVSGSSGVVQVPCAFMPGNLNNASFGNFTGAVLGLEMYDVPDNGYVLDFLVGDGPRPVISA